MTMISRRGILRSGTAMLAGAGLSAVMPGRIFAQSAGEPWGEIEPTVWGAGYQPKRVLELILPGGLSIWESFWVNVNPDTGEPLWRGFADAMATSRWHCPAAEADRPSATGTQPFEVDELGNLIHWGPATKPLWPFMDRTRMVVLKHDIPIHEAALPLALTGTRLGNPRHAGAGAAIEHRWQSVHESQHGRLRVRPYAYFLLPQDLSFGPLLSSAFATGRHPGVFRPLKIKIGANAHITLPRRLQRHSVTAGQDELLNVYRAQYRDMLRTSWDRDPIRSSGFTSYDASADALLRAPELTNLLTEQRLEVDDSEGIYCIGHPDQAPATDNPTATCLRLARDLLLEGDARYVLVADAGLQEVLGAPYDTHSSNPVVSAEEYIRITSSNLYNALSHLAAQINPPGSQDPGKINLNDTLVVITSEFTRTPARNGFGREHFPSAYVSLVIGGPIITSSIAGGMTVNASNPDSVSTPNANSFTPTDVRAAILLAAGVRALMPETFGTNDLSDRVVGGREEQTMENVKTRVLGV